MKSTYFRIVWMLLLSCLLAFSACKSDKTKKKKPTSSLTDTTANDEVTACLDWADVDHKLDLITVDEWTSHGQDTVAKYPEIFGVWSQHYQVNMADFISFIRGGGNDNHNFRIYFAMIDLEVLGTTIKIVQLLAAPLDETCKPASESVLVFSPDSPPTTTQMISLNEAKKRTKAYRDFMQVSDANSERTINGQAYEIPLAYNYHIDSVGKYLNVGNDILAIEPGIFDDIEDEQDTYVFKFILDDDLLVIDSDYLDFAHPCPRHCGATAIDPDILIKPSIW